MDDNSATLKVLAEVRRTEQFLFAARNGALWMDRAHLHLRAANVIYEVAHAAHEREFAQLARGAANSRGEPTSHILVGQELEDAYDARLLGEYFLLCGYGLECLFKGCLLAMLPELVVDDRRLDNIVKTHDLAQFAHDCAVSLSEGERSLLRLMTRHIVWGKYPVPLGVEQMPSGMDSRDFDAKSLAVANPFLHRRVQRAVQGVVQRAEARLEEERRR